MQGKITKPIENLATLCGYYVDELELPSPLKWTADEVLLWIKALGFPQYQNTFEANLIDGQKLILVNASALVKMNIKDFDHVKKITKEIRNLFKIELENLGRSVSLPSQNPETLFKFFKVSSGPFHELCQRTEFFQKMNLISEAKVQLNHFEDLHKWLQHIPEFQRIRIGNIKRVNLFFVKSNPNSQFDMKEPEHVCHCEMPPCECNWTEKEKRKPWQLSFLIQVAEGKYDEIQ